MRLNNKGFAPAALAFAVGAAVLSFILLKCRTNEYANIPETKAVKTAKSNYDHFTVKKGETVKILGAEFVVSRVHEKGEGRSVMLLVQTAKGERDLISKDIIPEEMFQEILPELKKHTYATTPGLFCRKTMTKAALDSIPLGISIEAMDSLLYPTKKAYIENGMLKADYRKMQIFDKSTGKFSSLYVNFKDGRYVSNELPEQGAHMNAWLLKFLPGTNWVYDHNILNYGFSKKAFGRSQLKDGVTVAKFGDGHFLRNLMGLALLVLFFVVIFGFNVFIPMLPAYTFYGLLTFPPLFKPFDRILTDIFVFVLTALAYYYIWLTYMPYMSFFIMPVLLIPAAMFAISPLLDDDICDRCRYMNTYEFDHEEFLREYDTERDESNTSKVGSRITGRRQTWDNVTHTTKNAYTGQVVSQYTNKENIKNFTDYEDTYQTDSYHRKYHVKVYRDYYKCEVCGTIRTRERKESKLISSQYLGSSTHTTSRTEQH